MREEKEGGQRGEKIGECERRENVSWAEGWLAGWRGAERGWNAPRGPVMKWREGGWKHYHLLIALLHHHTPTPSTKLQVTPHSHTPVSSTTLHFLPTHSSLFNHTQLYSITLYFTLSNFILLHYTILYHIISTDATLQHTLKIPTIVTEHRNSFLLVKASKHYSLSISVSVKRPTYSEVWVDMVVKWGSVCGLDGRGRDRVKRWQLVEAGLRMKVGVVVKVWAESVNQVNPFVSWGVGWVGGDMVQDIFQREVWQSGDYFFPSWDHVRNGLGVAFASFFNEICYTELSGQYLNICGPFVNKIT